MNRKELEKSILCVKEQIDLIKLQIDQCVDSKDKLWFIRQKKDLQYKQLWQLEMLGNMQEAE